MSKTVTIGILLFFVVLIAFAYISNRREVPKRPLLEVAQHQPTSTPLQMQPVDKQASFAIYTNGTFRIFTASMYHNLSDDVFIEASNPNIIKIKKTGITWYDFFSSLPFKLTHECLTTGTRETYCTNKDKALTFYLNGEKEAQILDRVIRDRDKLLITYGNESVASIKKQLEKVPNL